MVIVDQSSSKATELAVAPYLADARIRYVHTPLAGASRARNLGVSLTTAPIIAITDDDCIVPKDWLSSMSRPFRDHADVGVVFCSVEPVPVTMPGHTPHIIFEQNRIVRTTMDVWKRSSRALSLGAGMAVRRKTFEAVSGFDELLGPGAKFGAVEDNDLSWRSLLCGWATFQCADVRVLHDGFRNLDELRSLVLRDMYGVGGTIAKYLRAGKWQIVWMLMDWLLRLGIILPARDLLGGHRPRGFRRPFIIMHGIVDGFRTPLNRPRLLYHSNSFPVYMK
jgi:GT2 family glycosyltransferase